MTLLVSGLTKLEMHNGVYAASNILIETGRAAGSAVISDLAGVD